MSPLIHEKFNAIKRPGSRFQFPSPRMARVQEWRWNLVRVANRQPDDNNDGGTVTNE
jgi:hypothetical protein